MKSKRSDVSKRGEKFVLLKDLGHKRLEAFVSQKSYRNFEELCEETGKYDRNDRALVKSVILTQAIDALVFINSKQVLREEFFESQGEKYSTNRSVFKLHWKKVFKNGDKALKEHADAKKLKTLLMKLSKI